MQLFVFSLRSFCCIVAYFVLIFPLFLVLWRRFTCYPIALCVRQLEQLCCDWRLKSYQKRFCMSVFASSTVTVPFHFSRGVTVVFSSELFSFLLVTCCYWFCSVEECVISSLVVRETKDFLCSCVTNMESLDALWVGTEKQEIMVPYGIVCMYTGVTEEGNGNIHQSTQRKFAWHHARCIFQEIQWHD
jgi:hypothetical protein